MHQPDLDRLVGRAAEAAFSAFYSQSVSKPSVLPDCRVQLPQRDKRLLYKLTGRRRIVDDSMSAA